MRNISAEGQKNFLIKTFSLGLLAHSKKNRHKGKGGRSGGGGGVPPSSSPRV